jgi:hypothetical protein
MPDVNTFITAWMEIVFEELESNATTLASFFNGSYAPGAVNLFTNTTAQAMFKTRIGNWLGAQLECDGGNWNAANHPSGRPLAEVHGPMRIFGSQFTTFNDIIIRVLLTANDVSPSQIEQVRSVLDGTRADIVFTHTPCDRIGDLRGTSGASWILSYSNNFIENVTASESPFSTFFVSRNYTTNPTLRAGLATRYAAFLGTLSTLNCTYASGDQPTPANANTLAAVHHPLGITSSQFDAYVARIREMYIGDGASTAEANMLTVSLEAYRESIVSAVASPGDSGTEPVYPPSNSPTSVTSPSDSDSGFASKAHFVGNAFCWLVVGVLFLLSVVV